MRTARLVWATIADAAAIDVMPDRIRTRVGHAAWLVTGHDEVEQLLSDDRLGRSHPGPDNAAPSGDLSWAVAPGCRTTQVIRRRRKQETPAHGRELGLI